MNMTTDLVWINIYKEKLWAHLYKDHSVVEVQREHWGQTWSLLVLAHDANTEVDAARLREDHPWTCDLHENSLNPAAFERILHL